VWAHSAVQTGDRVALTVQGDVMAFPGAG
jgi:hypothetical protein